MCANVQKCTNVGLQVQLKLARSTSTKYKGTWVHGYSWIHLGTWVHRPMYIWYMGKWVLSVHLSTFRVLWVHKYVEYMGHYQTTLRNTV
jgi:hypothetical protein